jgi:hypothetical protein
VTLVDANILHAAERLASAEFEAFKLDYEGEPVPRRQELRAGCIAWLVTTLPEAFDVEWIRELEEWLRRLNGPSPDARHWFRVPALRAATWLWNDDTDALREVIANVDHHNSGLRAYILESLAFAAPGLSFDDDALRGRVESVLQRDYLYSDAAVAVLLSTRGTREAKGNWARRWVDVVQPSFGRDQLSAAINGAPVTNPLHEGLCEIERYALSGLLGEVAEDRQNSVARHPGVEKVFAHLIRTRLAEHPLMNSSFRIAE